MVYNEFIMSAGKNAAKKIAVLAILTALSLITFIIESLFPPLIIPGAKMGLANVFSFAALIMYSPIEAFAIVAIRTVLGAVYAGNFSAAHETAEIRDPNNTQRFERKRSEPIWKRESIIPPKSGG